MKFLHCCPEWDEALIDETDGEFMSCMCWRGNAEAEAIQSKMAEEHLEWNMSHDDTQDDPISLEQHDISIEVEIHSGYNGEASNK